MSHGQEEWWTQAIEYAKRGHIFQLSLLMDEHKDASVWKWYHLQEIGRKYGFQSLVQYATTNLPPDTDKKKPDSMYANPSNQFVDPGSVLPPYSIEYVDNWAENAELSVNRFEDWNVEQMYLPTNEDEYSYAP